MSDERINAGILKERAHAAMETIRESLPRLLSGRLNDFMSIVNSRPTELELFIQNLINGAPELVEEYQRKTEKAVLSMSHVTDELVIALIESMPEEFCDSRLFKIPFSSISVSDNNATERARKHARDRLVSLIREISSLLRSNKRPTKVELSRYANTLTLLEDLRV
jgi:hypothetical protein